MKTLDWLADLRFRNPLLYRIGMVHFILAVMLVVPLLFDSREVLGINPWIKPIKFCLSIGIYAWTFGWMLWDLHGKQRWIKGISWAVAISMLIEIGVIIFQASRATRSHFNEDTVMDQLLFGVMGGMIGTNTIAIVIAFGLFLFTKTKLDKPYLLAVRLAFVVFLIGNWVGGQMIKHGGHAVGAAEDGPGIPFFNWNTLGGDLRIGHFIGLHAIQVIPLISHYVLKKTSLGTTPRYVIALLSALAYGGIVALLYWRAAQGLALV